MEPHNLKRALSNTKLQRLLRCYTQEYVADKLGMTREHYNALENGRKQITGKTLYKLATLYGCQQSELI